MNNHNLPTSILLIITLTLISCTKAEKPEPGYDPEAKLEALNITLPTPPQPVANYVNGVQAGNLIFLAGKGPRYPDGTEITGKLGQDVTIERGYEGAQLTAINQLSVLKAMLGDLSKVKRIVKVLGLSLIHISEPTDRTRSRMPSSA